MIYNEIMKKSILQKILSVSLIFVCLFFVTNMFSGCSLFGSDKGFEVVGHIIDDYGKAVEGVKVDSNYGTTYTNENGEYVFSKVKNGIIISPSIDNYKFSVESKSITNEKDNADFVAYKQYIVSGKVENNGIARADVGLVINSLSGTFYANTDDNGEFKVSGVAGETTISPATDGVQFYPVKANINKPSVTINTSSKLTLNLSFDSNDIDFNKIRLYIDDSMVSVNGASVTYDVHYKSKIKFVSDYYAFNKPEFNISSLDQVEDIEVYKLYSVTGKVTSGKTNIAGASVRIAGEEMAVSNENGEFEILNLSKTNELKVYYSGLTFNSFTVSQDNSIVNFNGTKSVYIVFDCDYRNLGDVSVSHQNIKKVDDNTCVLENVCLGDEIELSSDVYYITNESITIATENLYSVSCFALYDLDVTINGNFVSESDFNYLLDNKTTSIDSLKALYGNHKVSASYKNYKFDEVEVNYETSNVVINYLIPYNVSLSVKSGDLVISNAVVEIGETNYYADSDGNVQIDSIYGNNNLIITADGYNSQTLVVSESLNKEINLTYDVSGIVKTNQTAVMMANVYIDGNLSETQTSSEGIFELKNLTGSHLISINKNNYTFEAGKQVYQNANLEFDGSYKIFGTLSDETSVVPNATIYLVDVENNDRTTCTSNIDGYYEFTNLTNKYLLYTLDSSGNFKLKPNSYTVTAGGKYDFSLSGFMVAGKVMSGNVPVAFARVTATLESEIMTTYTNAEGEYCFELVASDCAVSVYKEGYEFGESIEVSEDNENVNFNGTYSVFGTVVSGSVAVYNVNVFVDGVFKTQTDIDGRFVVSGLEATQTISFEKSGFVFDRDIEVSSYGNLEVLTKANVSVQVKTGNIVVDSYEVYNGKTLIGSQNGNSNFEFVASLGDEISIVKTGYQIEKFVVEDTGLVVVQSTYSISGKATSGGSTLSNVIVINGDAYLQTNAVGEFTITGLSGQSTISFVLEGYAFEDVVVTGYNNNLNVNGTYKVTGTIKVGDKVLSNVKVVCTDALSSFETTTDENGIFKFDKVSGRYSLSFNKDGYSFASVVGTLDRNLDIKAFYQISGKIVSGDNPLNIDVTLKQLSSGVAEVSRADSNGNFTFTNIEGPSTISVLVNGYTLKSITINGDENIDLEYEFNDSVNNLILNMSYAVTFSFNNIIGVDIYIDDEFKGTSSSKQVKIDDLEGSVNVRFERKNTYFLLNNIPVSAPSIINVPYQVFYDVSGVVKSNGLAIEGLEVKAGGKDGDKITYTDANGNYKLEGVAGELVINESNLQNRYTKSITKDGTYDFSISNADFAFMLYKNAYDNLDNASSFQIETTGKVTPNTSMSGPSSVRIVSKKDNNGNFIRQHANYGSPVAGVDPRVSLVTARINGQWYYQQIGGDNVNSNFTANHTAGGLTRVTESEFATIYGAPINCYLYYNISYGVCTFNNVSVNGNGNYTFTMTLSNDKSVWQNYATHSHKLMSAQTMTSFEKIEFIFEITKDGWIVGIQNNERYNVQAKAVGITVNMSVDASLYHKYYTQSSNIKIDNIDISNDSALNNSLVLSSQTTISSYSLKPSEKDVVSSVIYG